MDKVALGTCATCEPITRIAGLIVELGQYQIGKQNQTSVLKEE